MHLACLLTNSPSPHSVGVWRHRRSFNGFRYNRAPYWEHLGRSLERGCFDMLFLADTFNLHDNFQASADTAIRHAVQFPRSDPMPVIAIVGRVTRHLGLAVTGNTTYLEPFYLARMLSTLDDLTEGRVGWNVVAGLGRSEAENFGRESVLGHAERYARAEEYLELCYKLWASWEPDAVIADAASGVYADPAKVHRVDHAGTHFRCRGPLSVPQTPQGRPTIIQAGASSDGVAFAARHAEVHFASRSSLAGMQAHRTRIDAALAAAGRPAGSMKVLWGVMVFVGEDEAAARERERRMLENVSPEAGLSLMSGHFNYDLSTLPMDRPLERIQVPGSQGIFDAVIEDFGPETTLREAGQRYGCGLSGLRLHGSPEQVADLLEEADEAAGGDGFMLMSTDCLPGSIDDFVDLVVPELQRRGRVRRQYRDGTLREQLFGDNVPKAGAGAWPTAEAAS